MTQSWSGKKVTVLGLGRSGISTAAYLLKRGAKVLVSEKQQIGSSPASASKQAQVEKLKSLGASVEVGEHSEQSIAAADLIVVSPGIPPSAQVIQLAQQLKKEVICDVELAYRECNGSVPIVAITGTNGKSTTCALTSYILENAELSAPPCGNFGVPILDLLDGKPDYLVAEVSSYQLHYCPTFAPKIGVWLNLTPDHIEWHAGLDPYIKAKQSMFSHQSAANYAVLSQDDPIVASLKPPSEVFPFSVDSPAQNWFQGAFMDGDFLTYRIHGQTNIVCRRQDLKILGKHNLENALASIAVAALLRIPHERIVQALKTFTALEHRLEFVATISGVDFFNDSKATNPTSTIKALEAFGDRKAVLIAGGRDKHTSLTDLVQAVKKHVSHVILLGEAKERFATAFEQNSYRNVSAVDSLEEAVDLGVSLKKGPVLLSPACASFDMFQDYEERGRVFKNLVRTRLEKMAPSR